MIRKNTRKLLETLPHSNIWLLEQWTEDLETQINVRPGTENEAHPTKINCWTNGVHTWKHIRWPYNSDTNPNFKDFTPEFPFDPKEGYVESVGTTWWNWITGESHAVVFDFDSIIGHNTGLAEQELQEVLEKISGLDYVTVIKSTSGNGYHVLVFFDKRPVVANHAEHKLVAEVTLNKMSEDAGFDFADKVDCLGMIGWIWSVRAGENGFAMVKKASRNLNVSEIEDWTKIPAKRMRHRPRIVAYDENGEEITGNNILGLENEDVAVEKQHLKIIRALEKTSFSFNHVQEHNLFHTHTAALKEVHKKLDLKGPFATVASGQGDEKPNCFIRPMKGGGFVIFRFGKGTPEHPLWDQTDATWCTYNQAMPPHKAILRMGGEWIAEHKWYEFQNHSDLVKCVDLLGNRVPLRLKDDMFYTLHVQGRGMAIHCHCEADQEPGGCDGWERVRGYHKKVLSRLEEVDIDSILPHVDATVRYACREGQGLGWVMRTSKGWMWKGAEECKRCVRFMAGGKNVDLYMDTAIANPWTLVNQPFEPENLKGRKWNPISAQLVAQCATKPGPHLNWDRMLNQVGQSLDEPLKDNMEMRAIGICTGADYLRAWIASMIRYPESPLPYMFLVGPQNSGKSLCHEVLRECFTRGVIHGGNAMLSSSGFNGEFEGKVLVTIDETDLREAKGAGNKLKAWVNATYISIHKKGFQPYDTRNFMKFWQSAQTVCACIIEHGDTRIMVLDVPAFEGKEIPKEVYIPLCLEEFPNFLYTLGTMQLPALKERTRLPIISTEIKEGILESTEPDVLAYLKQTYHNIPGHAVRISEAYEGYKKWCTANNVKPVAPNDFKLQVGLKFPVYRGPSGRAFSIGNISLDPNAPHKSAFIFEGKNGRHERVST